MDAEVEAWVARAVAQCGLGTVGEREPVNLRAGPRCCAHRHAREPCTSSRTLRAEGTRPLSHPFCTRLVTCTMAARSLDSAEGRRVRARRLDAYLEPFTRLEPASALREALPLALWVAHVGRALCWDHMLSGVGARDRAEWQPRIAEWLRLWTKWGAWTRNHVWP